eukprot:915476-Pyramimonas_sp.AAC.2
MFEGRRPRQPEHPTPFPRLEPPNPRHARLRQLTSNFAEQQKAFPPLSPLPLLARETAKVRAQEGSYGSWSRVGRRQCRGRPS